MLEPFRFRPVLRLLATVNLLSVVLILNLSLVLIPGLAGKA